LHQFLGGVEHAFGRFAGLGCLAGNRVGSLQNHLQRISRGRRHAVAALDLAGAELHGGYGFFYRKLDRMDQFRNLTGRFG